MSVSRFGVRAAGAADLAVIVALERGIAEAPHWVEAEYSAVLNVDRDVDGAVKRCLVVAEEEGRLLGFAVGKVIGAGAEYVSELESVVVAESARRCGVGRALCGAVVAWCGAEGAATVELEVRAGSLGAISLYAGLGFVVVGGRGRYYKLPTEDAVLMRLELMKDK